MNTANKVTKHNRLATVVNDMTLPESRLLTCILAQVRSMQSYSSEYIYTVTADDMVRLTKGAKPSHRISKREAAKKLKIAADKLWNRTVTFEDDNGDLHEYRWASQRHILKNRAEVQFNIAPEMAQFLFGLEGNFYQYLASEAVAFRNRYTLRIYELIQSRGVNGKYEVRVSELRKLLALEHKYQTLNGFRNNLITPVLDDLNACTCYDVIYDITKHMHDYLVTFTYSIKRKELKAQQRQNKPLNHAVPKEAQQNRSLGIAKQGPAHIAGFLAEARQALEQKSGQNNPSK